MAQVFDTSKPAGAVEATAEGMLSRLVQAINDHDLDTLVDCFAPDYRHEIPAHPARGFVGRDGERRIWEQIFQLVPDIHGRVPYHLVDGETVWTEWEMSGTGRNGDQHREAGVIVFGVADGRATWSRFYLELVENGGGPGGPAGDSPPHEAGEGRS